MSDYFGWGTAALQLVTGLIFIVHGWPKLKDPAGIAGVYAAPKIVGTLHGLVEVFGGSALIFGWWREQFAIALILIMLGALYFKIVRWKMPFSARDNTGWEFDLLLIAGLLTVVLG